MTAKAVKQRRKDGEQAQGHEDGQAHEHEHETPPRDQAGDVDRQDVPVAVDEEGQASVVVAAAGVMTAFAALGAMSGTGGARTAVFPPPPSRVPTMRAIPKPMITDESMPLDARLVPVHERAPEAGGDARADVDASPVPTIAPELELTPATALPPSESAAASDAESESDRKPEQVHAPVPAAEREREREHEHEHEHEHEQVDVDEAGRDEGEESHESDEFDERDDRDDSPAPTEVAALLRLSLQNDTGLTDSQRKDFVTADATVRVDGVTEDHDKVEYRIDEGPWMLLGDDHVIHEAQFRGDGVKRVDVRSFDSHGGPLSADSLHFELDTTGPVPLTHQVVHPMGRVNEAGDPDPDGSFWLTKDAQVKLLGLEDGAMWAAHQYTAKGTHQVAGESAEGQDSMLTERFFKEGPQLFVVGVTDRAGNSGAYNGASLKLQGLWLDTTPPPAPQWSPIGEALGVEQFQLDNLERHAHLEHRRDEHSDWQRLREGVLTGPMEVRQVDLAGNSSLESARLGVNQILTIGAAKSDPASLPDREETHAESLAPLRLRLLNDTGVTEEQKSDLITRNATVRVEGVDSEHGQLAQYRIDAGEWRPLGERDLISDADFPGDGAKQVDVRTLDPDGRPRSEASLAFKVDRGNDEPNSLTVVHDRGLVFDATPEGWLENYVLTNQPLVRISGIEPGARFRVWQSDPHTHRDISGDDGVEGSGELIPEGAFREGGQTIRVKLYDSADKISQEARLVSVWLDTTPPPAPEFLSRPTEWGHETMLATNREHDSHFQYRGKGDGEWTTARFGESILGPVEVRQVDRAGNPSQASDLSANQQLLVAHKTAPPEAPQFKLSGDDDMLIPVNLEEGGVLDYRVDGVGRWKMLVEGKVVVGPAEVRQRDQDGNVSQDSFFLAPDVPLSMPMPSSTVL
ncbi:hypothetical protein [Roseateles noduli]|uniref:hypothetical protein n=1 Tax=Roseateles noduli TaxID=2052484 RepID=UPI003D659C6B